MWRATVGTLTTSLLSGWPSFESCTPELNAHVESHVQATLTTALRSGGKVGRGLGWVSGRGGAGPGRQAALAREGGYH